MAAGPYARTVASWTVAAARIALEITHAVRGCHQWGRGQEKFGAAYKATIRTGGRVDVRESEQMIFDIAQTAGPAMSFGDQIVPGQTRSWVFRRAGTYRVKLVNVEKSTDVGLQSLGEDNVLTLTVVVR